MKKIIITALHLIVIVSFASAETNIYTLKAVKYHDMLFSEWGIMNDKNYETAYDGMQFEIYENSILIGNIIVFQNMNKKKRIKYPEIGRSIKVESFTYKVYSLPISDYNIEYDEMKQAQQ
jgi:hypothetical protein